MKKIFCFTVLFFSVMLANAQYIGEVLEYQPAPGQLINELPWGIPSASNSIVGTVSGSMSLGAFGGYVVFKFAAPVENHAENPYGVDFTIFGNPSAISAEPGIVSVMKDVNGNGLPDDTWYELVGSDYFFSTTIKNYAVTYTNPIQSVAANVLWSNNQGGSGTILANPFHTQPYYPKADSFPQINAVQYTLSGTKIKENIDRSMPAMIKSYSKPFGYADNRLRGTAPYTLPDNPYTLEVENSGGDAFDIDWAVDTNGDYVDLDVIHFVKVHNAVQSDMGWLGEVSTEITGAVDVAPNNSISGVNEMLVLNSLPDTIKGTQFQLETAAFRNARYQEDEAINWIYSMPEASINGDNLLSFTASGTLTLTASLASNAAVTASVSTVLVYDENASAINETSLSSCVLYPNPASDFIGIQGVEKVQLAIYNLTGNKVMEVVNYSGERLAIFNLPKGIYIALVKSNEAVQAFRFIKE